MSLSRLLICFAMGHASLKHNFYLTASIMRSITSCSTTKPPCLAFKTPFALDAATQPKEVYIRVVIFRSLTLANYVDDHKFISKNTSPLV